MLTVTGNADAGRTIIGTGTTVLDRDGSYATGVFGNLEITGRIILSGAVTATGDLTLVPGARLNLNGHSLIVGGQLITNVHGRRIAGDLRPGSPFIAAGLEVNGLVLENAPLTIDRPADGHAVVAVRQRLVRGIRARGDPADRQPSGVGRPASR